MSKKTLKNRIAIVLDRSSSMQPIRAEAVQMFNDQVKAIKKNAKKMEDTTVSLFTFSTNADEPILFNRPAKELKEIGLEDYRPDGWTALYDSVGMAIERLSALTEMSDPDCSFLVIIVTDGEENRSQRYSGQRLADHIQLLEKAGRWTFTFCGANIDIEKMRAHLKLDAGNVMAFTASSSGLRSMSVANSASMDSYFASRASGQSRVKSFYNDPSKQSSGSTTTTTTTTTTTKSPTKPKAGQS